MGTIAKPLITCYDDPAEAVEQFGDEWWSDLHITSVEDIACYTEDEELSDILRIQSTFDRPTCVMEKKGGGGGAIWWIYRFVGTHLLFALNDNGYTNLFFHVNDTKFFSEVK
jgi:hypothetical protein